MDNTVILTKEELIELLKEAYEAGWYGSIELRDDIVKGLADRVAVQGETPSVDFGTTIVGDDSRLQWVVNNQQSVSFQTSIQMDLPFVESTAGPWGDQS